MQKLQRRLHDILNNPEARGFVLVNDFLALLTIVSIFALILETVESLAAYTIYFKMIEATAVFFFTLEYASRIFAAKQKLRYIFSFFGIIDLLSILPWYLLLLNFTFLKSVRVLRILRFLRMVRLAKLTHLRKENLEDYDEHTRIYKLNVQIYFFALFSAIVIFGSLLYVFESTQPGASDLPLSMIWIAKVIMGGVSQHMPETAWGDLVIIGARFCGLLLFGLLIHIVGNVVQWVLFGSREITR